MYGAIVTLIVVLIITAAVLAFVGLAREAWRREQIRRRMDGLRRVLLAQLERERRVHDRVQQLPLAEEADDYIESMSLAIDRLGRGIANAPWHDASKGRGSATTGKRA
jgi:type II secretory pathway pseudopilin PulG